MSNRIKPEVQQRIKDDDHLILLIAQAMGKRWRTVYQWVMDNSDQLLIPAVLQVIAEHYQLSTEEIVEQLAA